MIRNAYRIISGLILTVSLLLGCASPPPTTQKSYWHIVAEEHLHNGLQYYQRQQFRQALNQFGRALDTYQRFNHVEGELHCRINLAKTSIALNQLDAASRQIGDARHLIAAHGMHDKNVHLDIMQSSIAIQQQALEDAQRILDRYPLNASPYDDAGAALLINKIRLAFLQQRDVTPLLEQLKSRADRQHKYQPRLWRFQAQQAHIQKQYDESDGFYGRALQYYRNDANAMGVLATLNEWAARLIRRQDWQAAGVRYEDMYKTAVSIKQPHRMIEAVQGLIQVYENRNDQLQLQWARQQMAELKSPDQGGIR